MDFETIGFLVFAGLCCVGWGVSRIVSCLRDKRELETYLVRDDEAAAAALESEKEMNVLREELNRIRALLSEANERADRNAAIVQGLTEDLAALKNYDEAAVEERLQKIREIRADEVRREAEKKRAEMDRLLLSIGAMSQLAQYGSLGLRDYGLVGSTMNAKWSFTTN